jgi:cytochrome c oxidase subunit 2
VTAWAVGGAAPAFQDVLRAVADVYLTVLRLPPEASTVAPEIDWLHFAEITIFTIIAIVYFGTAVVFLVRYRRRSDAEVGRSVHAGPLVAGYAGAVFLLFGVFWIVSVEQFRTMHDPPAGTLDVYVVAKQWMWQFAPATGMPSIDVLYVPTHQPVRLLLTSRDVIHSFFVPAFRLKQDAVPGTYTTLWFEATHAGRFAVRCAQMCGVGHARMDATIVALDPADYDRYRSGDAPVVSRAAIGLPNTLPGEPATGGPKTLVETGRDAAAAHGCLKCHSVDGQPHIGPTWLGLYGSTATMQDGSTAVVDPAYITESMMDPTARIVRGFPAVMPSYQGLIDPADTAAIIQYIQSLAGPTAPSVPVPQAIGAPFVPSRPAPGAGGQP